MNSQIAKLALSMAFIVILSLILGTNSASDRTTSFVIIGAIVGLGLMLALGRRVWWLMILFPAIPIAVPGLGFLPKVYMAVLIVLPFMLGMVALGKYRLSWHKLWVLDIPMLALLACIAQAFVRNPSGLAILGWEGEYVGGKEYVLFTLAALCYVTYSLIPTSLDELRKLMRVYFVLITISVAYNFLTNGFDMGQDENLVDAEAIMGTRFTRYAGIGAFVATMLLCRYSLPSILCSLWKLPLFLCGVIGVLLSGYREQLLSLVIIVVALHVVRRQYVSLLAGAMAAVLALLALSESKILKEDMPFGVQRSLAILPFLDVSREAKESGEASADWRVVMWRWALDERESYIKDRVWGDGFRIKTSDIMRESMLINRGQSVYGDQEFFARTGTWHSGPIECMNRIGIVGLCVCTWLMMCMVYVVIRACRAVVGMREGFIFMYAVIPVIGSIGLWYLSAGTMVKLLAFIPIVGMAKLMYCLALREGVLEPVWHRSHYVPLMLRTEQEPQT